MTIIVEKDGSLTIFAPALDAAGAPKLDAAGNATGVTRAVASAQINAHRKDPAFESALQAAAKAVGAAPELVALAAQAVK